MALDFLAIASNGAFPTPTPTDAQRSIYAASWGLLGTAAAPAVSVAANTFSIIQRGFRKIIGWVV